MMGLFFIRDIKIWVHDDNSFEASKVMRDVKINLKTNL